MRSVGAPPVRRCRHRVPPGNDVLACSLRRPACLRRRGAGGGCARRRRRFTAAPAAHGGRGRGQGVPCGASGPRNLLEAGGRSADSPVRHPGRGDGLRLRRSGLLRRTRAVDLPRHDRQIFALHRLGPQAARGGADRICDRRRDLSPRRLQGADQTHPGDRPSELARRRDEGPCFARDLRTASRSAPGNVSSLGRESRGISPS